MTVDIGNLIDLVDGGITQALQSDTLNSVIPANLRGADGKWYALSLRDRVLYVANDLKLDSFHYEDLADAQWKNKVCRSEEHTSELQSLMRISYAVFCLKKKIKKKKNTANKREKTTHI